MIDKMFEIGLLYDFYAELLTPHQKRISQLYFEDNYTPVSYTHLYSGASILGGETVIGEGSTIGGNAFVTSSVPPNTTVLMKNPELVYKS